MQLSWEDLRLFLAVYEAGSLSAAARALGLGQATLSRRMSEMESAVGEPLFVRGAQGVRLTAVAQRLLPSTQRMAEWASEASLSLCAPADRPAGRVRIAAPPGLAQSFLAPFAARLQQQYPELRLEVLAGEAVLNLSRGEADLSMRVMPPSDPELICLDQISGPIRVFAAPSYASSLRRPYGLADLRWISWAAPFEGLRMHQALVEAIPGFTPSFSADDYNVQYAACVAGVGALLVADIRHRYSQFERLLDLGLDLGPTAVGTMYLVCHRRQRQLPKVQAVIDALREELEWARQASAN
ncbi:LysR family transcriptional regulator [Roseateles oligotrophus]|uniref:LysR family transcriptional regulator n=1 Tax=Roseateles oligotrophus TaxID=1769250 RepID=A0ABT2YB18_9BURK|nr:LysR family transcriptional regulator [Roseateles oligotrophus]MCV2367491.1 LysR family transcriptional regulator [Roseateles oligotrophus]